MCVMMMMIPYITLPERGRRREYVDGQLQLDADLVRGIVQALDPDSDDGGDGEGAGGVDNDDDRRLAKLVANVTIDGVRSARPALQTPAAAPPALPTPAAAGSARASAHSVADVASADAAPQDACDARVSPRGEKIEGVAGGGGRALEEFGFADEGSRGDGVGLDGVCVREPESAVKGAFNVADSKVNRLYLAHLIYTPSHTLNPYHTL